MRAVHVTAYTLSGLAGSAARSTAPVLASTSKVGVQCRPAVGAAKHAALGCSARTCGRPRREYDVRISRIDQHGADMTRIVKARAAASSARIARAVHAAAGHDVVARLRFTGAGVQHIRIGRRHGECAHGRDRRRIGNRSPAAPRILRLPDATAGGAAKKYVSGCVGTPTAVVLQPPRCGPTSRHSTAGNADGATRSAARAWGTAWPASPAIASPQKALSCDIEFPR